MELVQLLLFEWKDPDRSPAATRNASALSPGLPSAMPICSGRTLSRYVEIGDLLVGVGGSAL